MGLRGAALARAVTRAFPSERGYRGRFTIERVSAYQNEPALYARRALARVRELLERAESEGRAIWLTDDLPRSFILADSRWGEPVVYISPLSSATLAHRAEQKTLTL